MQEPHDGNPRSVGARCARAVRGLTREVIITVVPALLLTLLVNTYIAQATEVDGPSMQPNLYSDYRVMTEKVSYRLHQPRRGDIAVIKVPGEPIPLMKRVLGLPGETIEVRGGHTFINNTPIREPWVTYWGGKEYPPTLIPVNHIFVLGDNRKVSYDSRWIGPVSLDLVDQRVVFIYWPLSKIKFMP